MEGWNNLCGIRSIIAAGEAGDYNQVYDFRGLSQGLCVIKLCFVQRLTGGNNIISGSYYNYFFYYKFLYVLRPYLLCKKYLTYYTMGQVESSYSSRRSSYASGSAYHPVTPMVVLSPAHHPAATPTTPTGPANCANITDSQGKLSVPQPGGGRMRMRRSSDIGAEILGGGSSRGRSQSPSRLKIPGFNRGSFKGKRRKSADEAAISTSNGDEAAPLPKIVVPLQAELNPKKSKRRGSRTSIFPVIMGSKRRSSKHQEENLPQYPPQARKSLFFIRQAPFLRSHGNHVLVCCCTASLLQVLNRVDSNSNLSFSHYLESR